MASLEFDSQINALYLRLKKGRISTSEPLADNITVDLDSKGNVLGFEVLLPPKIRKEVKAQIISSV